VKQALILLFSALLLTSAHAQEEAADALFGALHDALEQGSCCQLGNSGGGPACTTYGPTSCLNSGGAPGLGPCDFASGVCAATLPICCEYDFGEPFCDQLAPVTMDNFACRESGGVAHVGACNRETGRCQTFPGGE
jgi:hypothetical protein